MSLAGLLHQTASEAEGEGHHGEGGELGAAAGEDGRAGDGEVDKAVDGEVGVDDAGCGVEVRVAVRDGIHPLLGRRAGVAAAILLSSRECRSGCVYAADVA